MMPALDETGPDKQGCCGRHDGEGHGHGHGHKDGGRCCGGRRGHDGAAHACEAEIAALEQKVAENAHSSRGDVSKLADPTSSAT
jgi:hypothetical protein